MSRKVSAPSHPVAVVGMGCIFPGSSNLKGFWNLLFNGIDAVSRVPSQTHWNPDAYFDPDPSRPDHVYCQRGGFLPATNFNPMEFGIPPNNMEVTDTAQLLGLHVAKMALEDAGILSDDPVLQEKKVNVILGVTGTQELVIPLGTRLGFPVWEKALDKAGITGKQKQGILDYIQKSFVQWQENSFPGLLGNVVAGRIANRLNLSGTNSVSDAACASSLSAVHTAIMELSTGRCDLSITGGVDTLNDIFMHMCFARTGVLSHTGDARPFSKDADGTVLGEGIGMLVLKRLEDAQRDNDRIYAVIKGMGTSSDGRTSGIYAPDANGQLQALTDAYERAGVEPASVALVEAHGTGTRVGDKVEFTALHQCYGDKGTGIPTALGSVKSMIGHTKAAAGAAGMIKAILALYNKVLPPTLKISEPDPELAIASSRFYLNQEAKPWVASAPRRSGVSAFGFGGSNFHVVLEEAQEKKSHVSWDGSVQIFAFSASENSRLLAKLRAFSGKILPETMKNFDDGQKQQYLASLAHESRGSFSHRDSVRILAVYQSGNDLPELVNQCMEKIREPGAKNSLSASIFYGKGRPEGKIGFLFPGQGSQYPNMGRQIFSLFPEALEILNLAQEIFGQGKAVPEMGLDEFLFPLPEYAQPEKEKPLTLQHTQIAQPAIGTVSLAMTRVLERFGLFPAMACGHSFGELSALAGAGWISREDFLTLARTRGQLMAEAGQQSGDPGSMLAIQSGIEKVEALITEEHLDLVIANRNAPLQCVVSGRTELIEKAKDLCRQRKMRAVQLPVAAAFHSSLVNQAAGPFTETVKQVSMRTSKISVLSNTKGTFYPDDLEKQQVLLGRQLAHPVDFITNVNTMYENGIRCFVEVGPKTVLTGLTKSILKGKKDIHVLATDASSGRQSGIADLAKVLAALAAKGYELDLSQWEEPCQMPKPGKMAIPVCGANPRPDLVDMDVGPVLPETPSSRKPNEIGIEKKPASDSAFDMENQHTQLHKGHSSMSHFLSDNPLPSENLSRKSHNGISQPASVGSSSLQLLKEGFHAMEKLQAQTARAHEKFLETQAAASRTLGAMLEHSRMAVTGMPPMASVPVTEPVVTPKPAMVENDVPVYASVSTDTISNGAKEVESFLAVPEIQPAQEILENPSASVDSGIMETLKEVISQLTGYPVEMLEPSMNMESDLGIDSIKKVEILSELEKRVPHTQELSPDHMATVSTLEDMCAALGENDSSNGVVSNPVPSAKITTDKAPVQGFNGHSHAGATSAPSGVYPVLVEVVSQLTGYPVDMLEPSMELDSDLGVDSIKRVEILSAMERQIPDLPSVPPDEMAEVKTLEDIARVLSPDVKTASHNGQDKKKIQKNLI